MCFIVCGYVAISSISTPGTRHELNAREYWYMHSFCFDMTSGSMVSLSEGAPGLKRDANGGVVKGCQNNPHVAVDILLHQVVPDAQQVPCQHRRCLAL